MSSDFRVGAWTVQPNLNSVSRNGTTARVEPKVMGVLVCLASQPGEPVSKEVILERVWPGTFVSDDVLVRSISELRRLFEDDPRQPKFIETIPKRGYRLVAPVATHDSHFTPQHSSHPTEALVSDAESQPSRRSHFRTPKWAVVAAAVGLGIVGLLILKQFLISGSGRQGGNPKVHTLAVLPFQNLSSDSSQQYFADGVTDALITELSHLSSLKVISRTSVMPYAKTVKSLPVIARELNADGILEGTVQRSANRVRVTVQLILAPADQHLWANSYERDTGDVFALEDELAAAVGREIQVQLAPGEHSPAARRAVNVEALDDYLQGKYHLNKGPLGENGAQAIYDAETNKAEQYFRSAINKDPNYAAAYVGLGVVLAWSRPEMSAPLLSNAEGVKQGRAAIEKAIDLDPYSSDAHLELGRLAFIIDWDWPAAEREIKHAIELNPNLADAHGLYAEFLDAMGRLDEGKREFEILQQIDPGNQSIADFYDYRHQFEKLVEVRRTNVERQAYGPSAHWDLGRALVTVGRYPEAIDEWIETAKELNYPEIAKDLQKGYAKGGFQAAIKAFALDAKNYENSPAMPTEVPAYLYGLLGDKDAAFAALEKMYRGHSVYMPLLRVDSQWAPLRSDPRFDALVRRVGLPQ